MFGDLPGTGRVDIIIIHSQSLVAVSWWYFTALNDKIASNMLWSESIFEEEAWRHCFDG